MTEPVPPREIWLANLRDEQDGIALYEGLAAIEPDAERARTFRHMADGEKRHAAIWEKKLVRAGVAVPLFRPSARVRLLLWLGRRLGTQSVLPIVAQGESADEDKYARQGGDTVGLAAEEREHRETLARMRTGTPQRGRAFILERERWHAGGHAGSIRAAIFGMNDGLVSNLALVLGVAAAGADHHALVVTGLAGLCAGAFSMAVGEYVSVASQRDLLRRQIDLEARELAAAPEEEAAELTLLLREKGLAEEQAESATREIFKNPKMALDTLVREELGLDPEDLGSPVAAAGSSFVMFALGAGLPLVPLWLLSGPAAAVASGVVGGVVLTGVGAFLGFLSGTSPLRSGLRMLLLAALAAAVTIAVGRLVGVTLG